MICKQNVFHATNISSGAQMYTLVIILLVQIQCIGELFTDDKQPKFQIHPVPFYLYLYLYQQEERRCQIISHFHQLQRSSSVIANATQLWDSQTITSLTLCPQSEHHSRQTAMFDAWQRLLIQGILLSFLCKTQVINYSYIIL